MGVIAFLFADGRPGTYTIGRPMLHDHGWAGVSLVPTARIDDARHLSLKELTALHRAGWDVGSHGDVGGDMTEIPKLELKRRLTASHDWLVDNGFTHGAQTFAPPGHLWTVELTPIAVEAGFTVILARPEQGGLVPNSWELRFRNCSEQVPIGTIEVAIHKASEREHIFAALTFHDVVNSNPSGNEASAERLRQVCKLVQAYKAQVVTVTDLLDIT
jgi:peptidoglycan/xylan/chitin deacetylase (PgdA/CDA1 family)